MAVLKFEVAEAWRQMADGGCAVNICMFIGK